MEIPTCIRPAKHQLEDDLQFLTIESNIRALSGDALEIRDTTFVSRAELPTHADSMAYDSVVFRAVERAAMKAMKQLKEKKGL